MEESTPNSNSIPRRYVAKPREMPEVYHITSADPVSIQDYDYTFAPNANGEYDLYAWVEGAGEDSKVIVQEGERFRQVWMQEDPSTACQECGGFAQPGKDYCATHD